MKTTTTKTMIIVIIIIMMIILINDNVTRSVQKSAAGMDSKDKPQLAVK